ncbi:HIT domain-containing protein [Anaerolinea thermophila]|uniref:HIT family protein n=2 Tax=Anaerolinea TaxID=233189 RepID=UPI002635D0E6|nr:HIT domain-containing protein [Anaerolinea thermophila]
MQTLWSPWRMRYMMDNNKTETCIFCDALRQPDGVENLIVWRGEKSFVILNRYPYTTGHVMVVPVAHVDSLEKLDSATRSEMMELMTEMMILLRDEYHPEAFNLGANIGAAAGAGIAEHVHLHIVPRWQGDTNFMSTIGETRVIPEDLTETYRRIRVRVDERLRKP